MWQEAGQEPQALWVRGKVYQEDSEELDEVCQISCKGNRHRKVERQTLQDQNQLL